MPVQNQIKAALSRKEDYTKVSFIYQIVAFFADFCPLAISFVTSSKPCSATFRSAKTQYFY